MTTIELQRVDDYRWRVPRTGTMRTDGLIFADDELMHDLEGDQCIQQVVNVAHLPGIVGPSIAMPGEPSSPPPSPPTSPRLSPGRVARVPRVL